MFDVGFSELMVIAVVALLVIGPEHLPKVARTVGHLWGRAQRYINGVKHDISRDMALEELRQLQQKTQQEVGSIGQSIAQMTQETTQEWDQQVQELTSNAAQPRHELSDSHELSGNKMPPTQTPTTQTASNQTPPAKIPRHEIIEEHHAVLPASAEQKNTTQT